MDIKIFYDRENKKSTVSMGKNSTVRDLLQKMGINPVAVLVSRNNDLILENEPLKDNDEIKIISVISGG